MSQSNFSSQVKSVLYLPSDCRVALTANTSEHFNSTMDKDQTTTLGTPCPTLYDECVGSLTSLADHNSEDAEDGGLRFIVLIRED